MTTIKKLIVVFLIVVIATSMPVFGASAISVVVDEEKVIFTEETGEPYIDGNSRTQVPFRQTLESFGCTVDWDQQTRTAIATKDGITVKVPIGKNFIFKDNEVIQNDTDAVVKDGKTYLPIRVVLESFGYKVNWDPKTCSVVAVSNEENQLEEITIHFLDVCQGDSIFIDASTFEILIDGGSRSEGDYVSAYIKPFVDNNIDVVIATHMHEDHIGGLIEVFSDYNISEVIYGGPFTSTLVCRDFREAIESERCILMEDCNSTYTFGCLQMDVIELLDNEININNNSVATLFTYGDFTFLSNGDGESETEKLLKNYVSEVDVWKAGHHGSSSSNSSTLLNKIKPDYTVISAGEGNKYGHPHIGALTNIFTYGNALGTFKSGTIVLTTNGQEYWFNDDSFLTYTDAGDPNEYLYDNYYEDFKDDSQYMDDIYNSTQDEDWYNISYIGNKNSKVFHEESCPSVDRMKETNKVRGFSREELLNRGYDPCDNCRP